MAAQDTPLVITLWETYGSNMEEVAARLASDLKLTLHQQAYSSDEIEAATAEREREGALGRMLRYFESHTFGADGRVAPATAALDTNYAHLAEENTAAVLETAAQGGIIMGRNGQYVLRDRPNTFHVKLDGPVETRVKNAAGRSGIDVERAARRQRIEDDFRAKLSQKTYNFDPRDNDHYDLVVNGAGLSVDAVVAIIKAGVQAKVAA